MLADNERGAIIYRKNNGADSLYVIIHNSSCDNTIPLPEALCNKSYVDIYAEKEVRLETSLLLKPYSFLLLKETNAS